MQAERMDTVLAAEGLGKQVSSPEGTLAILSEVSFRVLRGESVAIMGASGAGKSTLLALLAGLDEPTTGTIRLAGSELTELDEDGRAAVRARHVGFVFQSFHLLPSLTALENVMLPLELAGRGDARAAALEVLRTTPDARGRLLDVVRIHQPGPIAITAEEAAGVDVVPGTLPREEGDRLAGSYVNSYIGNDVVVLPVFDDPHDDAAVAAYTELFAPRRIITVPGREILLGGGNVHCITQQQPSGR